MGPRRHWLVFECVWAKYDRLNKFHSNIKSPSIGYYINVSLTSKENIYLGSASHITRFTASKDFQKPTVSLSIETKVIATKA